MMVRRLLPAVAALMLAASAFATQAPASNGGSSGGSNNHYVTVVTGSDPAGTVETVDGVPATQAPGVFQQGTSLADSQSTASTGTVSPLSPSGCLNAGVNWKAGLDVFGVTMWKIWNHTHWCFSSWLVSSVTGWTDVYTAPGWTSSNKSWHWDVWGPSTDYTTSHADFCLASYFGCLQSASPNVQTWVNGAGNYSFDDSHWYPGT